MRGPQFTRSIGESRLSVGDTAGLMVRSARRTTVRIAAGWPWADEIVAAFGRLPGWTTTLAGLHCRALAPPTRRAPCTNTPRNVSRSIGHAAPFGSASDHLIRTHFQDVDGRPEPPDGFRRSY